VDIPPTPVIPDLPAASAAIQAAGKIPRVYGDVLTAHPGGWDRPESHDVISGWKCTAGVSIFKPTPHIKGAGDK